MLLATLAFAAPAAASVLVSNIGKSEAWQYLLGGNNKLAQGFTTGSQGATLGDVELSFAVAPYDSVTVQLGTGSSPGSLTNVITLTNPSPEALVAGNLSFTAPAGTRLAANTTYMVVVWGGGQSAKVRSTADHGEDPGGRSGWSVDDGGYDFNGSQWLELYDNEAVMIRVNGQAVSSPAAPARPTVSAVSGTGGSLSVRWTAPSNNGSAITDYDLRYYRGSADPADEADWVAEGAPGLSSPGTSTSATISALLANTAYRVQVRAENAGGESAWSASGSATTGSPPATNNAPRVLEAKTGDANNACQAKTGTVTPVVTDQAPVNGAGAISPLTSRGTETTDFPASCTKTPASDRVVPVFDDKDGDSLTITSSWTVPENVFPTAGYPSVDQPTATDGGAVWFGGVAALSQTDLRVDLTAVDAHGASVRTHVVFQVHPPTNTGPPSFAGTVGEQGFAVNQQITDLVLPAASGGDIIVRDGETLVSYTYAVSGLPAGLVFDPATRTISGTPTTVGSSTVTYTAEDADGAHTAGGDTADTASLTFEIAIKEPPTVKSVEIVSEPTFDTDGDGVTDTYGKNETMRFRVTFSEAMNVTGTPQLGFIIDPNYPAKQANYESGSGTAMLTFAFAVQRFNNARDGIAVPANSLALNGGTITTTAGGVAAGLAHTGLSADPNHKVNAPNYDATSTPALQTATVTAAALKLIYDKALDTGSVPAAGDFTVRVAGSTASLAAANPVAVSGTAVTLTLASAAGPGQAVTVSYTAGTNPIQDKAGNGAANLSNHAVARAAPSVESVEIVSVPGFDADGDGETDTYGRNETVRFRVTFSEAVTVTGTPQLSFILDPNFPAKQASYESGSATAMLTFAFKLQPFNNAPAGIEVQANALGLNGGTINAAAGGRAAKLAHAGLPADPDHKVDAPNNNDATAPALQTAAVNEAALTLTYDEPLDSFSVPDTDDFTVTVAGSDRGVSSVAVSGSAVTLTLASAVATAGQTVTVSYTADTNPIQDKAGNDAANLTNRNVTNNTAPDTTAPALQSATVDGAAWLLWLNYDEPLNRVSVPGRGRLHGEGGGGAR